MEMKFNIKFNCVEASTNELERALRERCTQVEVEEDGSTLYFHSVTLEAVRPHKGCVSDKHFVLSIPVDSADGLDGLDGVTTGELEIAIRNRCSELELDDGEGKIYLSGVQVDFEAPPAPTPAEQIKALEAKLVKAEAELQNNPIYRWEAKRANDILVQARRAVSWLDHANCVLPDDGENGSMRADMNALRALLPAVLFDEHAQSAAPAAGTSIGDVVREEA